MDLHILSLADFIDYKPHKPVCFLGIVSTKDSKFGVRDMFGRVEHPNYVSRAIFEIDDIFTTHFPSGEPIYTPEEIAEGMPGIGHYIDHKCKLFDTEDAKSILSYFSQSRDTTEDLVVACTRGRNRSPAVGIALNEIYSLGHDAKALIKKYNEANWYVYKMLLKTAKEHPELVR